MVNAMCGKKISDVKTIKKQMEMLEIKQNCRLVGKSK